MSLSYLWQNGLIVLLLYVVSFGSKIDHKEFFISFFKRLVSSEEAVDIDKQFWKTFQKFSGEVSEGVFQRGQSINKRLITGNMAWKTLTPLAYNFTFLTDMFLQLFPAIILTPVFSAYAFFTH